MTFPTLRLPSAPLSSSIILLALVYETPYFRKFLGSAVHQTLTGTYRVGQDFGPVGTYELITIFPQSWNGWLHFWCRPDSNRVVKKHNVRIARTCQCFLGFSSESQQRRPERRMQCFEVEHPIFIGARYFAWDLGLFSSDLP